ncbi:hypothetical protein PHYPSEUDO_014140 [Phytophthora pseudosyringae]|uniref:Uncharacterized protein n=1 Tax=Phytophthora pseudosyringae TaxID=221518 RepID=A0A8T1V7A7_9STRA|nr:hypothetical protein PHYPSEUDO_014140 [Phytophthora pseudosyringae]
MIGELHLRAEAPSPFFDDSDDVKQPSWHVILTFLLLAISDIEPALRDQVLAYQPASTIALVDDINLLQDLVCGYICMVAVRGYAGEYHQMAAVPLVDVHSQAISRNEFVLGFYHGLPSTLPPPPPPPFADTTRRI